MKPLNIFLIRHGQSIGNVNREVYKTIPDYALTLTDLGREQAKNVGIQLKELISNSPVQFYVSPFWRTRQTFIEIQKSLSYYKYYEDARLREQEWSQDMISREGYNDKAEEYRDKYGHFYYRFRDGGESCGDVADRMGDFMGTMFRDFEKKDFFPNIVIVTHGMAMRVFLMRFFHCSVEEFESWGNPRNCEYYHLQLNKHSGKYKLLTPLRIHKLRHNFQFNWQGTGVENLGLNKLPVIITNQ